MDQGNEQINGTTQKPPRGSLSTAVKSIFREHGLDVSFERMGQLLAEKGIAGCSQPTFCKCRNEVEDEEHPEPNIDPVLPADALNGFVKFALAVEAAGGIDAAKRYLGILETLFRRT
jgi:hypothetical protein